MILKSLSVIALVSVFGVAARPVAAQRPAPAASAKQNPAGKSAQPAPQPPARPKPWWSDDKSRKELGLTVDQTKKLDDIYNSAKDELSSDREVMERERKELDRLITESKVERWVVARQIDKAETARSNYNKLLFMMLYRMHQELTPEQRLKLDEIQRRDHGPGRDGRGPHDLKPGW